MNYYYVITGNYEKKGKRRWRDREVHIDKLSERELKNRLKSNYYGKVKWCTIDGTMTMIHRLLEDRIIEHEDGDEYRKTGFIIYGEEIRPVPIEVVTEYHLEHAWLLDEHDFKGKHSCFSRHHEDEPAPEAEDPLKELDELGE